MNDLKVPLHGPRQMLGGLLLIVTVWLLGPRTWQEIVRTMSKASRPEERT
jgi:hypothetical protein